MPVSLANSLVVYKALKKCGIGLVYALPETWLVHMIRMAKEDPDMILVRLSKEEAVVISAGAHLAGMKSADLAAVASSSGIPPTQTARTAEEFTHAFDEALHRNDLGCMVAKVEALGSKGYVTDLALLENRFQFNRHIENLQKTTLKSMFSN